jgi:glycosyltransferase involved in cell wall biosynthesis
MGDRHSAQGVPGHRAYSFCVHAAVDAHNLLTDRRGIGVYLRAVLPRIASSGTCELTLLVRHPFPALLKSALARELGISDFSIANRVPRHADVAWHPWNGTFFRGAKRNVVTMHDVAPFVFPAADERKRKSEQGPFELSARTANAILADSQYTKTGIATHLRVERERIAVVPLAASPLFSPGTAGEAPARLRGRPYVLYVGTTEERKNTSTLIAAWRSALAPRGIALAFATADDVPGDVAAVTNLSPERFRDLYRGALCFAFPSRYEGFGLPVLEAMACGTPVVVARAASLPEVCGSAARYVEDPLDVAEWARALDEVTSSPAIRSDLSRRGLEQAAKFSWDETARETLGALIAAAA